MRAEMAFLCFGMLVSCLASAESLREEMQREAGVRVDRNAALASKPGVGKVVGTPLACDGKPVKATQPLSEEGFAKMVHGAVSGVRSNNTVEGQRESLLDLGAKTADVKYKLAHPSVARNIGCGDGNKELQCR